MLISEVMWECGMAETRLLLASSLLSLLLGPARPDLMTDVRNYQPGLPWPPVIDDHPVVRLDGTKLLGANFTTAKGRLVYAFKGIPYAEPPVGKERFKGSRQRPYFEEESIIVQEEKEPCLQLDLSGQPVGSEDCLYLNVYTPEIKYNNPKYPVLVFYPPDGLFSRGTQSFIPRRLMDYNLVIVTVNYRVGILGFLSTGDNEAPGNFGIRDQVTSLVWVRRHIKHFGGDPDIVTVMGASTSAGHVHLLYFAPSAQGLFHQAVLLGSSGLNCWAIQKQPLAKAVRIGNQFGCRTKRTTTLVDCLRNVSAVQLTLASKMFNKFFLSPLSPFGPVVEQRHYSYAHKSEVYGIKIVLEDKPLDSLQRGDFHKARLLLSYNSFDGLYPYARFIYNASALSALDKHWSTYSPFILDLQDTVTPQQMMKVTQLVRQAYFADNDIPSNVNHLIQMGTDRLHIADILRTALYMAPFLDVNIYHFDYRGVYSTADLLMGKKMLFGSSHIDDLLYYFDVPELPTNTNTLDRSMADTMQDMLVRYISYGVADFYPLTTRWNQVTVGSLDSHNIPVILIKGPHIRRSATENFWGNFQFWGLMPVNEPWRAMAVNNTQLFFESPPVFIQGLVPGLSDQPL